MTQNSYPKTEERISIYKVNIFFFFSSVVFFFVSKGSVKSTNFVITYMDFLIKSLSHRKTFSKNENIDATFSASDFKCTLQSFFILFILWGCNFHHFILRKKLVIKVQYFFSCMCLKIRFTYVEWFDILFKYM